MKAMAVVSDLDRIKSFTMDETSTDLPEPTTICELVWKLGWLNVLVPVIQSPDNVDDAVHHLTKFWSARIDLPVLG
jgi:hypothetical protein